MIFLISVPFIISSLIIVFFTKKDQSEEAFNKILCATLLGFNVLFYMLEDYTNPSHYLYTLLVIVLYLSSIVSDKKASLFLDISCFASLIAFYTFYMPTVIEPALIGFLLLALAFSFNKEQSISLVAVCAFPLAIATLYINTENAFYPVIIMTLLGTLKYFIVNKTNKSTTLFNNLISLSLVMFLVQLPQTANNNSIIVFSYGSLFIVALLFVNLISAKKMKLSVIERVQHVNIAAFLPYIKIFAFNVFALVLTILVIENVISYITGLVILLLILAFTYLHLYYIENSHKF